MSGGRGRPKREIPKEVFYRVDQMRKDPLNYSWNKISEEIDEIPKTTLYRRYQKFIKKRNGEANSDKNKTSQMFENAKAGGSRR